MATIKPKIKFYTFRDDQNRSKSFFENYNITDLIVINENSQAKYLKPKKERICRFCNRSYPETTFKKKAHTISNLLGNRHLLNDFECDDCNSKFSHYETSLGSYLLLHRTIYGTKGRSGIPKISLEERTEIIHHTREGIIEIVGKNLEVNDKGLIKEINSSYIPISIYKAFIKMALSIIDDKEIFFYKDFIQTYLLCGKNDKDLLPLSKIGQYKAGRINRVQEVRCILFRKKIDTNIPFHIFSIYYEDFIFTLPIPLHLYDLKRGYYSNMRMMIPPTLLFSKPHPNSNVEFKQLDLGCSSNRTAMYKMDFSINVEELRTVIQEQTNVQLPENFKVDAFNFKPDL